MPADQQDATVVKKVLSTMYARRDAYLEAHGFFLASRTQDQEGFCDFVADICRGLREAAGRGDIDSCRSLVRPYFEIMAAAMERDRRELTDKAAAKQALAVEEKQSLPVYEQLDLIGQFVGKGLLLKGPMLVVVDKGVGTAQPPDFVHLDPDANNTLRQVLGLPVRVSATTRLTTRISQVLGGFRIL